jgi:hypothetical protein
MAAGRAPHLVRPLLVMTVVTAAVVPVIDAPRYNEKKVTRLRDLAHCEEPPPTLRPSRPQPRTHHPRKHGNGCARGTSSTTRLTIKAAVVVVGAGRWRPHGGGSGVWQRHHPGDPVEAAPRA